MDYGTPIKQEIGVTVRGVAAGVTQEIESDGTSVTARIVDARCVEPRRQIRIESVVVARADSLLFDHLNEQADNARIALSAHQPLPAGFVDMHPTRLEDEILRNQEGEPIGRPVPSWGYSPGEGPSDRPRIQFRGLALGAFQAAETSPNGRVLGMIVSDCLTGIDDIVIEGDAESIAAALDEQATKVPGVFLDESSEARRRELIDLAKQAEIEVAEYVRNLIDRSALAPIRGVTRTDDAALLLRFADRVYDGAALDAGDDDEEGADEHDDEEDADELDVHTDSPYLLAALADAAIEYSEECADPAVTRGDMRDGLTKTLDAARVYGDAERRARERRRAVRFRIANAQPTEESGNSPIQIKPEGADA